MARTARQDWGFSELTRKFERPVEPRRESAARQPRRWTPVPVGGTVHVGAWLGAVALSLVILSALHVGILKKNMEFSELTREKNNLIAENAQLSSEVAALSSPQRIQEIASGSLGMVSPGKMQYVYIGPDGARQDIASLEADGAQTAAP